MDPQLMNLLRSPQNSSHRHANFTCIVGESIRFRTYCTQQAQNTSYISKHPANRSNQFHSAFSGGIGARRPATGHTSVMSDASQTRPPRTT